MPAALSRQTADLQITFKSGNERFRNTATSITCISPIVCLLVIICFWMCLDLLTVVPSCNQNHRTVVKSLLSVAAGVADFDVCGRPL